MNATVRPGPLAATALRHAAAGDTLADQGRFAEALRSYEQALRLAPGLVEVRVNAGTMLTALGRLPDAVATLRRATGERPDLAEAQQALGDALREAGELDEAEMAYRRAIALAPGLAAAHCNLGATLRRQGRLDEAIDSLRRAVAVQPDAAVAWFNLGNALRESGRVVEAEDAYRRAVALAPRNVDAQINLGVVVMRLGRLEEAVACFRRALALRRGDPLALANLGLALQPLGQQSEARACLEEALARAPQSLPVRKGLAFDRALAGAGAAAAALLEGASASAEEEAAAADIDSTRVMYLQYDSAHSAAEIAAAHRGWAARHEAPLRAAWPVHANDRDAERRLRIGFLSADLRRHPVATFLEPVLAALDRTRCEVVLYANSGRTDATSKRLEALADRWVTVAGLPDAAVADRIRGDAIDILADLGGHTNGSQLLVLARKPAPVQAAWLGYPGTTGLTAIDWRVSDAICDPESDDALSSERVLRLSRFLCYPGADDAPAVGPLPSARDGRVTFGSFNNVAKMSDACAALYAAVLAAVPEGRLVLKSSFVIDAPMQQHHVARIARHGIDPARVTVLPWAADPRDHFAAYAEIDVALDSFPYGGTTTSCEALWMGVPVVTLRGDRHAARVGASLLAQLGLDRCIATTPDQYAAIARELARDPAALAALRDGLRGRLRASPLGDATGFAREFEAGLRMMWRDWLTRTA